MLSEHKMGQFMSDFEMFFLFKSGRDKQFWEFSIFPFK